jgi:hypothetical protein
MATKEEIDELLKKAGPLSPLERQALTDEADALKDKHTASVARLKAFRKRNSLTTAEREEVDAIRNRIGPEIKRAANLDRKTGRPVESVR